MRAAAGISLNMGARLLNDVGTAFAIHQNATLRDLPCKQVQCDEIWAFVGMKRAQCATSALGYVGYRRRADVDRN
jgi:hypothetical protein